MSDIIIVGAGNVGKALAQRLIKTGHSVTFALREGADPAPVLDSVPGAKATPGAEAAQAGQIIFIATPAAAALDAARALGDLSGKIIVDCTNPVRWEAGPVWAPPAEGSVAAQLAGALPDAHVLKGFNTFGAEFHADPALSAGPIDALLAGDSAEAKAAVRAVGERAGFSVIDAGPLRNAAVLENMAILWIHLALAGGKGRAVGFKLLGR
jgi:predicted dinucleotide-binding enzyme